MRLLLLVISLFSGLNLTQAQNISLGEWRGIIAYDQIEVPFSFTVKKENEQYVVTLKNGDEAIQITNSRWVNDSLVIPMHVFDAEIRTHVSENQMSGRWLKHYKTNGDRVFRATFNKPRFVAATSKKVVRVPAELKMSFTPSFGMAYDAKGLFYQDKHRITGTIMAEIGDYRYFEGVVTKDSLKASSFDGVHAFLLLGAYNGKQWQGELVLDNNYSEPWTGSIAPEFSLTDPFVKIDQTDPGKQEPYFDILTAGSGFNTLDPDDYLGKVTIIQLLGSWCPNSLDETNYLIKWYADHRERDIEVLAVFYEMNYSKAYGMQRMNDYIADNTIPYPTALGGPANKGQAALAFPFVNKLEAFPTLMILDKSGQVRYMHTYFQGPATGKYYKAFDKRFNEIVEGLLGE